MIQSNTSLKVLQIFALKLNCADTCGLIRALGDHPKIESIQFKTSKLGCIMVEQLELLEAAIIAMGTATPQGQPSPIKQFIIE